MIDQAGMVVGKLKEEHIKVPSHPTRIPNKPPVILIKIDSIRNWLLMSIPRAPTDIRRPISFVRSVTETSMMFMMPIPATSSEKAAATTRITVMVSIVDDIVSIISCWLRIWKSSSSPSLSLCCLRRISVSSLMASSVISSVMAEQMKLEKYVCAMMRFITVV